MPELVLLAKCKIPAGSKVTEGAIMPKILCCIEKGEHRIYVGNNCVRKFKQLENAVKNYAKVLKREKIKAGKILIELENPKLSNRKPLIREGVIGFDNVI